MAAGMLPLSSVRHLFELRGIKSDVFAVLARTSPPAVFAELTYSAILRMKNLGSG